jgi:hypothetical protein
MLGDESADDLMRVELQEATLSGHPLGKALVERLEKELGRRLRRGKAGRPRKQPELIPEEHREAFKGIDFRDGIAKAVSFARSEHGIKVQRPELSFALQGKMYPDMACHGVWGEIGRTEFEQLVSAVKNRILDFSLKIEAENPAAGEAPLHSQPVPMEELRAE